MTTKRLSDTALRALAWGPHDEVAREVYELRGLCFQTYQLLGGLSADLAPEHPQQPEIIRAMDNLVAAAGGQPLPHATLRASD